MRIMERSNLSDANFKKRLGDGFLYSAQTSGIGGRGGVDGGRGKEQEEVVMVVWRGFSELEQEGKGRKEV